MAVSFGNACAVLNLRPSVTRCLSSHLHHRDPEIPKTRAPCEPGALAADFEDGNITARVLVCPPAACIVNQVCAGCALLVRQALGLLLSCVKSHSLIHSGVYVSVSVWACGCFWLESWGLQSFEQYCGKASQN